MGSQVGARSGRALGRWRQRFLDVVTAHPHGLVAAKSALAAGLAWLVVRPFGGVADDYPYYAPLGAVVVMSTTAVSSIRTSVQAVSALGLGAALALVAQWLPVHGVLRLVVVVGVATGFSGWRRLGAMGVWVPFAALFVLILGGRDPGYYVLGYAGMTAVGAVVGVAVNLAAPQLPLARTLHAVTALRAELGRQLRALADDISSDRDLASGGRRATSSVQPRARTLERLVAEVREARRVNWRAGRWRELADQREEQARALERMAYLVEEVAALVSRSSSHGMGGDSELGDATARALESTAAMVEAGEHAGTEDEAGSSPREVARSKVEHLRRVVLERPGDPAEIGDALLIGASVTVSLERALEAWA